MHPDHAAPLGIALDPSLPVVRSPVEPPNEPSLDGPPNPPTRILGRDDAIAELTALLLDGEHRLVTLTGPAGVGKTRLAVAVSAEFAAATPTGVAFVDLAPVREPWAVPAAIAAALGVRPSGERPVLAAIKGFLADRRFLLLLDNFEHVLPAAPHLADLLAGCPEVRLLVTSRVRLRLRWERHYQVPPLAMPDEAVELSTDALARVPSVGLFIERATASDPAFALTPENAPTVVRICAHLEGLPLAIELAAAHADVLPPAEMAPWIERRLAALAWDAPDLPDRQRTLRGAIAWSYDLVSPARQAIFRSMAVFGGGWDLDAALAVAAPPASSGEPAPAPVTMLADLSALVDASLVRLTHRPGEPARFGMLETLREYAWECLEASGETEDTQARHAAHYLALAERAAPALRGPGQRVWFDRLDRDLANLRAAAAWLIARERAAEALRLAVALAYVCWTTGHLRDGLRLLEAALAGTPGDDQLVQEARLGLGLLAGSLGDAAGAAERIVGVLAWAERAGDDRLIVRAAGYLALIAWEHGQPGRLPELRAALVAHRDRADGWDVAFAVHTLGLLAYDIGDFPAATRDFEDALAHFERAGDRYRAVAVSSSLAAVVLEGGDRNRALAMVREGLRAGRELRNRRTVAWSADVAAQLAYRRAPDASLLRLLGGIDALRSAVGFHRPLRLRRRHDEIRAGLEAALGEDAALAAWADGRDLSVDRLAGLALSLLDDVTPAALPVPVRPSGPLSPREHEVLTLIAEGCSNREIARALFVSPSTVNFHVTSLLAKLDAQTRAQAVAIAARRGLL